MQLCEDTLSIRLTTLTDVLDAGHHVEVLRDIEALAAQPLTSFRDLSVPRGRERGLHSVDDEPLHAHVGAGFHQTARFEVRAGAELSVTINAGLHPYTGVYATLVDARVPRAVAASKRDETVALCQRWIDRLDPLLLNAQPSIDDAIQNTDSPRLIALAWGETAAEEAGDRPGREWTRGHFRFAATWLTYVSNDALSLLDVEPGRLDAPGTHEVAMAGGQLFILGADPFASAAQRPAQRALRDRLRLDALAARDSRDLSYWKRKR
ncbi:MAG: hypothetical protein H6700_04165 [Myxococcales bacterium]|nr:hypothetical protein [Myxococcales bacterium]MCB9530939.1 hypothetical protein [Myxococcales bacterium]